MDSNIVASPLIGKNVLITTNEFWFAPDGRQYKAVFGTLKAILSDVDTLGVKTNSKSTNWYAQVGSVFIAGCQILYVVETDVCITGDVNDFLIDDKEAEVKHYRRPSFIYHAV